MFRQQRGRAGIVERRSQPVSKAPVSQLPDPDMQAAPAALVRAALRARELARRTQTGVVILREGTIVEERVDDSPQIHAARHPERSQE